MGDNVKDPALKNFSRTGEYVKHTFKSALNGAIKGALIVGALALIPLALGPGLIGGAVGTLLSFVGLNTAGAATAGFFSAKVLGAAFGAAMFGAKVGAVVGGATGLMGAEDAVDEAEARAVDRTQRAQMRSVNSEMMGMRVAQMRAAALGGGMVAPGHGIGGMGMGQQEGMGLA
ncbi:MAG: hypothetical protein SFT92_00655 [Rickettsiales bacterium]|nr:hypothetical protein [Rickettsiales bacterium]